MPITAGFEGGLPQIGSQGTGANEGINGEGVKGLTTEVVAQD